MTTIEVINNEIDWLKDMVEDNNGQVNRQFVTRVEYLTRLKCELEEEAKSHNDDFTFSWNGGYYSMPRIAYNESQDFILANRKIQAIKIIRQHTDLGLKDAKDISECSTLFKQPVQPAY